MLAEDIDIGRQVAIKTFIQDDDDSKLSCANEVAMAGALDHPGVPPIYDVSINQDGDYFFVMRLTQGEPLTDLVDRLRQGVDEAHSQYPFVKRAELIAQLLRILIAAHQKNIIHRDIKLANIMVDTTGQVQLIDWGIAIDLNHTNGEGFLAGTPYTMSPEAVRMQPLDHRTDLYSVAAVFYEFLALQSHLPPLTSLEQAISVITTHVPVAVDKN